MSTELLKELRVTSTPWWAITIIGVLLATLLFVNLFVWAVGVWQQDPDQEQWIEISATLLQTVLPLSIIGLVWWTSSSGVDSLKKKTRDVLTRIIPTALSQMEDYPDALLELDTRRLTPRLLPQSRIKLVVAHSRGRCDADYALYVPLGDLILSNEEAESYRRILFRVELNVWKVNLNVLFPREALQAMASVNIRDLQGYKEIILSCLRHSLSGAGHSALGAGDQAPVSPIPVPETNVEHTPYRYRFNPQLVERTVNGAPYIVLVLFCDLRRDFLYETREQLYFAQDLMLMIKSVLKEGPSLFERTVSR